MKNRIASAAAIFALLAFGCGDDASKSKSNNSMDQHDMGADLSDSDQGMTDMGEVSADMHGPEDASPDADEPVEGGTIDIYFAGDLEPKDFEDGYSGQTPKEYEIALSKYHVQTSLDDPMPVPCFEHDEPRVANMLDDNLMGTCQIAEIPTDTYTHGRTRVDWVRMTVEGTLHFNGNAFPGDFTFFRAYSDTTFEGDPYDAGEGWIEYSGPMDRRFDFDFGETVPAQPGSKAETINGEFWFTFPFGRPLPIVESAQDSYWSRLHWEVYESFRWEERMMGSYTDGAWDVAVNPAQNEEVFSFGVTGAYVTSSID